MNRLWTLLLLCPLVTSCIVPLGYTPARAQGYLSDSASAQYLQLSMDYWKKGKEAQAAAGSDAGGLESRLTTLSQEFNQRLDGVTRGAREDEEIPTGDDTGVPRRTLAGVALAEALEVVARGRSVEEAGTLQEAEYLKVLSSEAEGRGLFLTSQSIWPGNTVRYRWASGSNPSPSHRRALLDSMDEWSRLSGGAVTFEELEASAWNNFQLTIGVLGCIILQDSVLEAGVNGRATIGYQCGSVFGYLKLQQSLGDAVSLRRTTLHELGHVLGLLHEHKRPDRDQWIDIASGGYDLGESDLGKVDEYLQNLRWKSVQVPMGPWSVTLYFPAWWKERNAKMVGTFDLKSVMIYSGFLTRKPWTDPSTGALWPAGSVVPWNTDLSSADVETVKALYP